jgi:hypothetical protein
VFHKRYLIARRRSDFEILTFPLSILSPPGMAAVCITPYSKFNYFWVKNWLGILVM